MSVTALTADRYRPKYKQECAPSLPPFVYDETFFQRIGPRRSFFIINPEWASENLSVRRLINLERGLPMDSTPRSLPSIDGNPNFRSTNPCCTPGPSYYNNPPPPLRWGRPCTPVRLQGPYPQFHTRKPALICRHNEETEAMVERHEQTEKYLNEVLEPEEQLQQDPVVNAPIKCFQEYMRYVKPSQRLPRTPKDKNGLPLKYSCF